MEEDNERDDSHYDEVQGSLASPSSETNSEVSFSDDDFVTHMKCILSI